MKRRWSILAAVLGALLVAALGGTYAYGAFRDNVIAKGVSVGGIDVGGVSADEASAALRNQVAAPLVRPVVVTYKDRKFTLSPQEARLAIDVDGMVQEALRKSRDGDPLRRGLRELTGGIDASVAPRVTYSRRAVEAFVRRVKQRVDRRPRDADISFSGTKLRKLPSRNGIVVRGARLERAVMARLVDAGNRTVAAPIAVRKPKVTTADLAAKFANVIVVDRDGKKLHLYEHLRFAKAYTIAVGQIGLETPAGRYEIESKAVNPGWLVPNKPWAGDLAGKLIPPGDPENPIKARWMEFFDGAGIHGTDDVASLGEAASHGCIRMAIPDVIELYDTVNVGTPVFIV